MEQFRATLAENGRIVIPASVRQALGMEPGEELILSLGEDELRITTQRLRLAKIKAQIRKRIPAGRSLVDELIAERREEAKRE